MANVIVDDAHLSGIADAIREKNGGNGAYTPGQMPEAIRALSAGGGPPEPSPSELTPAEAYAAYRPAEWLPMPEPRDDEMYLLMLIPEGASELVAFTAECEGNYTVETGTVRDGVFAPAESFTVASGAAFEAELIGDRYPDRTSDGFRQVMLRVSASGITSWTPATHPKRTYPTSFSNWNIVEISARLPSVTSLKIGAATNKALRKLRFFSLPGGNQLTNGSNMFNGCHSLITVLNFDTSNISSMTYFFGSCQSLIAVPPLDTSKATNMLNMFYSCKSLTSIPELDTSQVTNMANMFSSCSRLTSIPALNTSKANNMASMFSSCFSLTSIPELDTSNVTNMSSMFYYCSALRSIPRLDTSKVTNMSGMFTSCTSLTSVPQLSALSATSLGKMFSSCTALSAVSLTGMSKVTGADSVFAQCFTLSSLKLDPEVTDWAGVNLSLSDCCLGHAALAALLESLPAITSSKTLTLTKNPGVSELTDGEKETATGKGWTLKL